MKLTELVLLTEGLLGNIGPIRVIEAKHPYDTSKFEHTPLGSGYYAEVFIKQHKNTVTKVSELHHTEDFQVDHLRHDPYIEFVLMCMNNHDNPFLPRIYKTDVIITRHPDARISRDKVQIQIVSEMERLYDMADDPKVEHLFDQLFTNLGVSDDMWDKYSFHKYELFDLFNNSRFLKDLYNNSSNDQFKQAFDRIQGLAGTLDLHDQNWMIRLTSVGPQLVISDPVTPRLAR